MLKEIYSEAFIDSGKIREPIVFHKGLNTVMGAANAKNSIGKSTFLLVIDFAFGGSDYVLLNDDITNHVKAHDVFFTFEFKGKEHYFCRNTADHTKVYVCNKDRKKLREMSLQAYTDMLQQMYKMDNLGGTFRELISATFRIYGRSNYDEIRPLKGFATDSPENGIKRLLILYGCYEELGELKNNLDDAIEKEKTYKDAHKYDFIRGATNTEALKKNKSRIEELNIEKEDLADQSSNDILDMDALQADRLAALKEEIRIVQRERSKIKGQIRRLNTESGIEDFSQKNGFDDLKEFFPKADLRHIEEIEGFHKQLKKALKSEYKAATDQLEASLAVLDLRLQTLTEQKNEINDSPKLTDAILAEYSKIDREISNLQEANTYYEQKEVFKQRKSDLQKLYDDSVKNMAAKLGSDINARLKEVNSQVCGPKVKPPYINIFSSKSYKFQIPDDTGTGSRTRGMFLLDYVSLADTPLPAVVHDSVSIKQVEDKALINIFKLYNQLDKQCFIAIDKGQSYSQDGRTVPQILEDTTVLELSEGHELFGRQWNIED